MTGGRRPHEIPLVGRWLASRDSPEAPAQPQHDPHLVCVSDEDRAIIARALPYSMTGEARMLALVDAVRYCVRRGVQGAFAECGVWRGGSVLAMILTLQSLGVADRRLYLYDTFEGMTAPTEHDISPIDAPALETWTEARGNDERPWDTLFSPEFFQEAEVRKLLLGTGYPEDLLTFVRGPVEETLPRERPDELALLRLDTDWYESTKHELEHLYPRLAPGGVLIIDDYGHWQGARKATDEYLASIEAHLLLHRIDYTARIAIKA
jgi:O-methyltransferase